MTTTIPYPFALLHAHPLRRNGIEDHIGRAGLKNLWTADASSTIPPWDVKKDQAKKLATPLPDAGKIKMMSTDDRYEYAREMVLTYRGAAEDPPPNPLGYFYRTETDPRQALCSASIMMPVMLFIVQVMFSLIIWQMVAPNLVGLRWLVSAPGFERQWDAIQILDRADDPDASPPTPVRTGGSFLRKPSGDCSCSVHSVWKTSSLLPLLPLLPQHIASGWPCRFCTSSPNHSATNNFQLVKQSSSVEPRIFLAPSPQVVGGLSVGCRIFLVLVILARVACGWGIFCVGFTYTNFSLNLDLTLTKLMAITLILSVDHMLVYILPNPVLNLLDHVKLGNKHKYMSDMVAEYQVVGGIQVSGGRRSGEPPVSLERQNPRIGGVENPRIRWSAWRDKIRLEWGTPCKNPNRRSSSDGLLQFQLPGVPEFNNHPRS